MPKAVPRSLPWNSCEMSASAVANMIAPPMPWIPRAMMRNSASFASPHAADAIVNRTTPIRKSRLRPNRSASAPAVRTQVASPSAYASTTHCRSEKEASSARSIAGRATFTIVMSSRSMKVAVQTATSVHHFRAIRATYTAPVQQTLDVSNAVAAELAGISDGVLDALNERLRCHVRLRGNQLTLDGDDSQVAEARAVIDEIVELVEGGHQIGSHTVDAVLGTLEAGQDVREVFDAVVWRHRGKKIAPKTLTQKQYVDSIRRATVTFGIGPAGTGKTYLAMALAVAALHEREVARIILTRPAVEAGERLGFLPGDLMAKVDPYLRPLFDALYDMLDPDKANNLIERGTIEVAPLAFMRGRTLNDSFIILDEAQNTSPEQMQMFLTRLGFGSRVVVTGDITQIDLPRENRSGLVHVRDVLQGIEGIEFVEFGHKDVVRHKLVQLIVEAYKEHTDERNR